MPQNQSIDKNDQKGNTLFRMVTSFALLLIMIISSQVDLPSPVSAQSGVCTADFQSVAIPLSELGNNEYIRMDGQHTGFSGGLYPGGVNVRPAAHQAAAISAANAVLPLDANGVPDSAEGKIVMISIGMSNTNYEFYTFMTQANGDATVNPQLVLINGALPGQTSDIWADPDSAPWQQLAVTLENYQVTAQQVQVAWIKETQTGGGDFPAKAENIEADLELIVQNLKSKYPNVKIAFLSSRIYSYTYVVGLSPEPNAYETGFSVKWLIEKQINGDPALNYNPQNGAVMAPLLVWGPYLWANGSIPREDGLVWLPEDLTNDCTHPSDPGKQKVAQLLLNFFKSDSAATPWFLDQEVSSTRTFLPLVIKGNLTALASSKSTNAEITYRSTVYGNVPAFTHSNQSINSESHFPALILWLESIFSRI